MSNVVQKEMMFNYKQWTRLKTQLFYKIAIRFKSEHSMYYGFCCTQKILNIKVYIHWQRGYVCINVSLFVCQQGYAKSYSTNFHKIDWKGGIWATKKQIPLVIQITICQVMILSGQDRPTKYSAWVIVSYSAFA